MCAKVRSSSNSARSISVARYSRCSDPADGRGTHLSPIPLSRRAALQAIAAAGAAASSFPADAQIASLEVVAASKPGEGDDQLARAVAEGLTSTKLLPSAQVYNAPGDNGAAGLTEFAEGRRPRSDMLIVGLGMLGRLTLQKATPWLDRCTPLACLTGERQPIVVSASSPLQTLDDLVRKMREDPASLRWSGRALGDSDHQLCLMFYKAAGVDPSRLNYRAGDENTEVAVQLIKGEVDVATGDLWDLIQQIRGGTLRALGLSSSDRAPDVNIPTFREQGIDLAFLNWRGVMARDRMDPSLIRRFSDALEQLDEVAGWRQLLIHRYWTDMFERGDAFRGRLATERMRLARLLEDVRPG